MMQAVAQERLTRQELGWLLAQEAQGAAKALRAGVSQLNQPGKTDNSPDDPKVQTNLDVLDDAIDMLSQLQVGRSGSRRGRIDLAALLCEVAPSARIAIAPGAGTEVFGDETDLRRMLHVLVSQANANARTPAGRPAEPGVTIGRTVDQIKIQVELGPDASPTAALEQRWLSRMAIRYGGRVELHGSTQTMWLAADGANDQREVVELRKELKQAQQLGETYARELAALIANSSFLAESNGQESRARNEIGSSLELLVNTCTALERNLRQWVEPLRADLMEAATRGFDGKLVQQMNQRVLAGLETLGDLKAISAVDPSANSEPIDLSKELTRTLESAELRQARRGVDLQLTHATSCHVTGNLSVARLLLYAVVSHAIRATPGSQSVFVSLTESDTHLVLSVEDGGPVVPEQSASDLIQHRLDPTSLGRPTGVVLLAAAVAAEHLGGQLQITQTEAARTNVVVRLPRDMA